MPKITVELDLDTIFASKDKAEALYRCVRDDVLKRGDIVDELKKRIISESLKDAAYLAAYEKVKKQVQEIYDNPQKIQQLIENENYEIRKLLIKELSNQQEMFRGMIIAHLSKTNIAEIVADEIKVILTARISHLLIREVE